MVERKFSFDTEPNGDNAGSDGGATNGAAIPPGFIDPASLGGNGGGDPGTGSGPARRKRGRPPGSGGGTQKAASGSLPLNVNGVEKILLSIHTIAAASLQTPELILDEKEANEIAKALSGVAAQYDVGMSPKTAAWTNLAMVMGAAYGPRAIGIYVRKSTEEKPPAAKKETTPPPPPAARNVKAFDPMKIELPN